MGKTNFTQLGGNEVSSSLLSQMGHDVPDIGKINRPRIKVRVKTLDASSNIKRNRAIQRGNLTQKIFSI